MANFSTANLKVKVDNNFYTLKVPIYKYNKASTEIINIDHGYIMPEFVILDNGQPWKNNNLSLLMLSSSTGDYDYPDQLIVNFINFGKGTDSGIGKFYTKNDAELTNSYMNVENSTRTKSFKYDPQLSNFDSCALETTSIMSNSWWNDTEQCFCFLVTTDHVVFATKTCGKMRKRNGFMNPLLCEIADYQMLMSNTDVNKYITLENKNLPNNYSDYGDWYNDWYDDGNNIDLLTPMAVRLPDDNNVVTYEQFSQLFEIQGSINIKPFNQPGLNNTDDTNSGDTDGEWSTQHSGELSGHSEYNDLEASLFRVYALNKQQLSNLSLCLWNPNVLQALAQYVGKIEDVVIGLYSYPFEVTHDSNEVNINFNWLPQWADGTDAKGYIVTEEIMQIDFGNISIPKFSGTFYDYQPFSSAQLFIPYIGFVPLKMNEILGDTLNLKFNINVTTGDFCAVVTVKDKKDPISGDTYDMTIGYYNGNLARPLPLNRQEMFEVYKAGATLLGAVATGVMGVKGAMMSQSAMEGSIHRFATEFNNVNSYNQTQKAYAMVAQNNFYGEQNPILKDIPTAPDISGYQDKVKQGKRQVSTGAANGISAVTQANAPIERSGMLGGVVGRCAEQKAFILITYPHQNVPENQDLLGYATNAEGPLSAGFQGYTEVREIRISDPNATSSEIAEIEEIVRGGIII